MKVKSRIVRQTVVTLNEKDMERLSGEYGTLKSSYRGSHPFIEHLIGRLLGESMAADFDEPAF